MSKVYFKVKKDLMTKQIDFANDTIKLMCMKPSYAPDITHINVSDVVTDEVAGSGYERKELLNKTIKETDSSEVVGFCADNVTFTAINAGTIGSIVIFKAGTSDDDSKLISFHDKDNFPIVTNGGDIELSFDVDGIVELQ